MTNTKRAESLSEYVGQERVRKVLRILIDVSNQQRKPLPHLLICGPPGTGKTTLARLVSNELGTKMVTAVATAITTKHHLAELLLRARYRGVVFLDEVHRLRIELQEMLYSVMEDCRFDLAIGGVVVPFRPYPFTLIGATTRASKVSLPMRQRFGHILVLGGYKRDEMKCLAQEQLRMADLEIEPSGLDEVLDRCESIPRILVNLIGFLRDYSRSRELKRLGKVDVEESFDLLGVDELGLRPEHLNYLRVLASSTGTSSDGEKRGLSLTMIASLLSESESYIEELLEPALVQKGLVLVESRGRVLTKEGEKYVAGKGEGGRAG